MANRGRYAASKDDSNVGVRTLNVIMHGVFGYFIYKDCIVAFTPAVVDHGYAVARARSKPGQPDEFVAIDQGATLELRGICNGKTCLPHPATNPRLDLKDMNGACRGQLDAFHKSYFTMRLRNPDKAIPLEPFVIGNVYSGTHAALLNDSMAECPSLQLFVYQIEDLDECALTVNDDEIFPLREFQPNPKDPTSINLHVLGTRNQLMDPGMDEKPHLRRAFAALCDIFGDLDLFFNFPTDFKAKAVPYEDRLPLGVTLDDVTMDYPKGWKIQFGDFTNCGYANLMIVDSAETEAEANARVGKQSKRARSSRS